MTNADLETDYLIIGGGSAACPLADGLSADGRNRVTMLEAGGSDARLFVQMPLGYGKTYYDKSLNWCYQAEADPGLADQCDYWPRGKIIGGSSAINAMVYMRGLAHDYDDWRAAGNPGWGYDEVQKAYLTMEDSAIQKPWRGKGGPLHIADVSSRGHALCDGFFKASENLGLPFCDDLNAPDCDGVGYYQITTKNGRRMSAARAFLKTAKKRKNLNIISHAHVTKLIVRDNRLEMVEYTHHGKPRTILVKAEAILAAGAVNTPQIMQLSGLGPAGIIQKSGIKVLLANDNIGANMQDHVGLNYTYKAHQPTVNDQLRPLLLRLFWGLNYLLFRSGPLSLSLNQAGGFFRTDPSLQHPNMQLYLQPLSTLIPRDGERPLLRPDAFSGFSIGLSNCRPKSRGKVEIQSSDPMLAPKIYPNAYSDADDLAEMLAAVKFIRKLAAAPPLAKMIAEELRPGSSTMSDEQLINDIKARSGTVFHACSTCRMGPDLKSSVVGADLRVHGVAGLRIADASVFPNIISGNTNAPAMMVGFKAAQIIKETGL